MARGDIYNVEKVRKLSQEEGLNDRQIAEKLMCERATITRLRKRHNIPTCNLSNRLDKTYVCANCKKTITIRRKDKCKVLCKECENNYI